MRFGYVCGLSVALAGLWASALTVTDWNRTKLNDSAVKDEAGNIKVLGTEGSWNDQGNTKEKVFDGDSATFFDPPTAATQAGPCWAGIELEEPMIVTRIRYFGRSNNKSRMYDCVFEAANEPDFSDAVLLHTASEADGWDGSNWGDVHVAREETSVPFKYLRVRSPNDGISGVADQRGQFCGNAGEVEFYGVTEAYMRSKFESKEPSFPSNYLVTSLMINHHFTFGVAYSSRVPFYEVQKKLASEGEDAYKDIGTIPFMYDGYTSTSTRGYLFRDPEPIFEPTDYRVRAWNPYKTPSDWFHIGTITPANVAQGTWVGPTGSWGNENSTAANGEKVYDGDVETYIDLPGTKNKGGWTGLDLGVPTVIVGARAFPRHSWSDRLEGAMVQVADELMPDPTGKSPYEFVDPVTVGTFTGVDETKIAEVVFAQPVTARYVRLKAPEEVTFNAAEFEVDIAPNPQFAPTLTVTMSDLENEYAVLSWNLLDLGLNQRTSTVVLRATGPQGPWTELASLDADATTYTDDTLAVGPRYFYGVKLRMTVDDVAYDGPMSVASYRRGRRLDRDPADETTLLPGINPFTNGTIWNNSGNGAPNLFDGDTATYADINENNAFIGLDMGASYGLTAVGIFPRSGQAGRVNGSVAYGSNEEPTWDNVEAISETVVCTSDQAWISVAGTSDGMYRYLVMGKPEKANFYCNFAELRFYGWTPEDALSVLTAPATVTLTPQNGAIQLDWDVCGQVASYRVRRKVNDGEWADIAPRVLTNAYTDNDVTFDGTRYTYQIVSQGDSGTANSDEYSIVPYTTGNGTGLFGVYFKNFAHTYDPAEAVALTRVDPMIDFDWGAEGPGDAVGVDNFKVVWTGKIIIPFDGNYQFRLMHDDGARLMIDGTIVLNDWSNYAGANQTVGTVALTAGEHPIRIDFQEQVGEATCKLFWGGCLNEEIVPMSQLIPEEVALDPVQEPWLGTRTLGGKVLGQTIFNDDGSVTISAGGEDTWNDNEGFRYLWRTFTGPFTCSMKIDFTKVPAGGSAARAMLMIRNDLPKGSPMFVAMAQSNHQWNGKVRAGSLADGVAIRDLIGWVEGPTDICWLQIKRTQNLFIVNGKTADDAEWSELFRFEDTDNVFNNTVYIGPACGSGGDPVLMNATFSNFSLSAEGTMIILQ